MVVAEGGTGPVRPGLCGSSFARALMAALNAGEDEAMNWKVPPAERVGSRKFGTPCERIRSANLMLCAEPFEALLLALGLLEAPPHRGEHQQASNDENGNRQAMASQAE